MFQDSDEVKIFQVPSGDKSPELKMPTNNELNAIYQNLGEVCETLVDGPERAVSTVSARLYFIANGIGEARNNRLEEAANIIDKGPFIKAFTKRLLSPDLLPRRTPLSEKQLKARESEIGAKIFGPIAPNERREFFNDNQKSWFFHQEITNKLGITQAVTLHYEVHPNGILRISSREDTNNEFIKGQELDNFISATEIYYDHVMRQIYNRDPSADKKAA